MSILVVCRGCHKRFKVGDQYAGQTGACPNCKEKIEVPKQGEEVQVHTPTAFAEGGRGVDGTLVTKPIARRQAKWNTTTAVAIGGAILVVLAVAWIGGKADLFDSLLARGVALLLISPPLAVAAYTFLQDAELEPHTGKELYIRAAACGLVYILMWWMFGYVVNTYTPDQLWQWIVVVPVFLVPGGLVAAAILDLEFGDGFFHYMFYVLVTIALRSVAGLEWLWAVAS